jgi:hypothetical protein
LRKVRSVLLAQLFEWQLAGAYDMHAAPSGAVINLRPSGIRSRQQALRK